MKKNKKDPKKIIIIAIILYSITMLAGLGISYYTSPKGKIQFDILSTLSNSNETYYKRLESIVGSRVFIDVSFNASRGYIIADFVDKYNRTINNVTITDDNPSAEINLDADPWAVFIIPKLTLDVNQTQILIELKYYTHDPTILLFMDIGLSVLAFASIILFFMGIYRYYQRATSGE
jgi:flagellar basal body-associated protein FliL